MPQSGIQCSHRDGGGSRNITNSTIEAPINALVRRPVVLQPEQRAVNEGGSVLTWGEIMLLRPPIAIDETHDASAIAFMPAEVLPRLIGLLDRCLRPSHADNSLALRPGISRGFSATFSGIAASNLCMSRFAVATETWNLVRMYSQLTAFPNAIRAPNRIIRAIRSSPLTFTRQFLL